MDIQYYTHGYDIYACLDRFAFGGIFRISDGETAWEYLEPNSPDENIVHQTIYWTEKADKLSPEEVEALNLPPLPPVPKRKAKKSVDYFLPKKPVPATRYPALRNALRGRIGHRLNGHVLLYECTGESVFGSGIFYLFGGVFLSEEDLVEHVKASREKTKAFFMEKVKGAGKRVRAAAKRALNKHFRDIMTPWKPWRWTGGPGIEIKDDFPTWYHPRKFTLALDGRRLRIPFIEHHFYDYYLVEDIFEGLETLFKEQQDN